MNKAIDKYQKRLLEIPLPGGNGCHPTLLGIANLGVIGKIPPKQIFYDLRYHIPQGNRHVPDKEIWNAINRALEDHGHSDAKKTIMKAQKYKLLNRKRNLYDFAVAFKYLISNVPIKTEDDLWEASPIRIDWPPTEDPINLLKYLYQPNDLLFIGDVKEAGSKKKSIRTAEDWISNFTKKGVTSPHILINPLTGNFAPKKGGTGKTLRGDGCISKFRFCLIEFDNLTRDEQLRFWSSVQLPICALIDSGGKSIHAWIDISKLAEIRSLEDWKKHIRNRLYSQLLIPLGVDAACSNPARLSRMPGHFRTEKNNYQRLLWLSSEGRSVI